MSHRPMLVSILAAAVLLAACDADEPHIDPPPPDTDPPIGAAEPDRPDLIDPSARAELADRLDRTAGELRDHVTAIRIISPEHFLREFDMHRSRVEAYLDRLDDTLEAARDRAGDEAPEALGLERGRHRALADESSEARRELDRLEQLTPEALPRKLPGHVERLRRLAATGETIAAHLRRS